MSITKLGIWYNDKEGSTHLIPFHLKDLIKYVWGSIKKLLKKSEKGVDRVE